MLDTSVSDICSASPRAPSLGAALPYRPGPPLPEQPAGLGAGHPSSPLRHIHGAGPGVDVTSVLQSSGVPAASPDHVDALVREHLPLVQHEVAAVVRRLPGHVSPDDLLSAGSLALVQATRSFDAAHGVPFARYAARRIAGALVDELRSQDWASRSVRRRAREQEAAADVLALRLAREASPAEVAEHLGVPVGEVAATRSDVHRSVVLSWHAVLETTGDEPALPSAEPAPELVLLRRERDAYLHDAVALLPERLRAVVTSLYFEEGSIAELADELGVTQSRVSQLRSEALTLMRAGMQRAWQSRPAEAQSPAGRAALRRTQDYCAALASRSTPAQRLGVTVSVA